jgi:SAM-dependent methyltransferase
LPPVTAPPRSIHAAQPPIGKPVGDARDDVEPVTPAAKLSSSVPPTPGASLPESYPDIVFEEPPAAAPPQTSTKNASESSPPPHAPTVVDASEAPTPVAATGPALPPARPRAQATMDPEELAVDAESDPGRASEPPEISPEDVVSVEPVLDKGSRSPSAPPPPMRPRAPSNPGIAPSLAPAIPRSAKPSSPRVPTTTVRTMVVPAEHAVSSAPAPQTGAPPIPLPRPPPLVIVPGVSPLAPPPMTDAASTRKRVRPWWEELFNDDFIRTMAKITDGQVSKEVDFIEDSLGLAEGAMVLDLACGTGRHAIELTRRGYQVVGFDLSLAMLAKAADEAQDRQQKLNFVQGDMREMTFDGTFDGVYSWSTSFGFFEEEKNAAVVANVRRALKPGGQLLLDVVNRDFVAQQNPSMVWFEGDGCVCMDDMSIDWITSRMKVKRTMMMDDGRSREIEYSIRIYSLHELGKLLHDNGFGVTQVSGRVATPGIFLGADSPRTLILAEKK